MRWAPLAVVFAGTVLHLCRQGDHSAPRFEPVADGLYSLTQWWQPVPGLPRLPVSVYLVQQAATWALVDAGFAGSRTQPHAEQLVQAVRAAIPAGEALAAIILTHVHPDHVGALPWLLAAHPNATVFAHEAEGPFLTGERHYVPPGGTVACLARWTGLSGEAPVAVPASRLHLLEEPLGDFSSVGLEELVYIITAGRTPGHISLLHSSSRTLLAGDAISFLKPSLALGAADAKDTRVVGTLFGITLRAQPLDPRTLCFPPSCDRDKATIALCMLADGLQYDTLLASHDWAGHGRGGWGQADMQKLAAGIPKCVELGGQSSEGNIDGGPEGEYAVEEDEGGEDEYE